MQRKILPDFAKNEILLCFGECADAKGTTGAGTTGATITIRRLSAQNQEGQSMPYI